MSDKLTSRVVSPEHLDSEELSVWDRLCGSIPAFRSPFYSAPFSRAVAAVRSGVRVCVLRRNGTPVGFLPFQYTTPLSRWLAAAEPVGNPLNDYFGLIADPDVRVSAQDLLRHSGLCYLGFTHLEESQLGLGLEGEQPQVGLRIHLAGDGTLGGAKKSFVEDTARRQRKLEAAQGQLRFRFAETDWAAPLQHLIDKKRQQYKETKVADPLTPEWTRAVLKVLAGTRHDVCSGVLSTLYAGDTWVASHFGLRSGNVLHYWFPVYNPDLREFAPGRMLLKRICEAAENEGVRCIDRGAGDSQAKRDMANERHLFYRGAWFQPGMKSTTVRAVHSLKWRLAGQPVGKAPAGSVARTPTVSTD
jgi:CelD/BcsL family acetyltransferase involved in cellulose biosynthesis